MTMYTEISVEVYCGNSDGYFVFKWLAISCDNDQNITLNFNEHVCEVFEGINSSNLVDSLEKYRIFFY